LLSPPPSQFPTRILGPRISASSVMAFILFLTHDLRVCHLGGCVNLVRVVMFSPCVSFGRLPPPLRLFLTNEPPQYTDAFFLRLVGPSILTRGPAPLLPPPLSRFTSSVFPPQQLLPPPVFVPFYTPPCLYPPWIGLSRTELFCSPPFGPTVCSTYPNFFSFFLFPFGDGAYCAAFPLLPDVLFPSSLALSLVISRPFLTRFFGPTF